MVVTYKFLVIERMKKIRSKYTNFYINRSTSLGYRALNRRQTTIIPKKNLLSRATSKQIFLRKAYILFTYCITISIIRIMQVSKNF